MADVTGVTNLTSASAGDTSLTGIKSAVTNLNTDKAESSTLTAHTGASTNVHGLSGGASVVGDTSTQTLTNKTLSSPSTTGTDSGTATLTNKTISGASNTLTIREADLSLADNTTANVSTTKHGFTPKAPNDTSQFLRGDGSWAGLTSPSTSLTAGENIAQYDAVSVGDGAEYTLSSNVTGSTTDTIGSNVRFSQSFSCATLLTITKATIRVNGNGSGGTLTIAIRADSAGQPTGSDLVTGTTSYGGSEADCEVTFGTPLSVTPGTTYHVIVQSDRTDTSVIRDNNSSVGTNKSSNGGSTWAANNGKLRYIIKGTDSVSGSVYRACTLFATSRANAFIGIAPSAITSGNSGTVALAGLVSKTGLTPASTYYLSDTPGALSASAGTVSRKVGIGVTSSLLLIKYDNV